MGKITTFVTPIPATKMLAALALSLSSSAFISPATTSAVSIRAVYSPANKMTMLLGGTTRPRGGFKFGFGKKGPRTTPEEELAAGRQRKVFDSYGSFVNPRAIGYQNSAKKKLKAVPASFAPGKGMAARRSARDLVNAKPNSVSANYPVNKGKNIQIQKNGFGNFINPFQLAKGKSKYGMPVFLANGNINPAFLAAERKDLAQQRKKNIKAEAGKVKKMMAAKTWLLEDFIRYDIGEVDKETPRSKGI